MSMVETKAGSISANPELRVRVLKPGERYCLRVTLWPAENGMIPVSCPALHGIWSQGENEAEAVQNIKEALLGAIEEYRASKEEIPWQEDPGPAPGETHKWVWLDVG